MIRGEAMVVFDDGDGSEAVFKRWPVSDVVA